MGWSIGYDQNWNRDIGYGVPAQCDHPDCTEEIHRGLSYVCGDDVYGGEHGCGLFFCSRHLAYDIDAPGFPQRCDRCFEGEEPFTPSPDVPEWLRWKLTDSSWASWRAANPDEVDAITQQLATSERPPSARAQQAINRDQENNQ